jgi:long-chain acyl-CoA synthetase
MAQYWPSQIPPQLTFRQGEKPLFQYLRSNARRFPDKTALIYYGREISYRELDEMTDRFAGFLVKNHVRKGDRIALFMPNCPQYIIAHHGAQKAGVVVGPCSPLFKEWELEYQLNDLGADTIVVLDQLYPIVEKIRSHTALKRVIVTSYGEFLPPHPTLPLTEEMRLPAKHYPDTMEFGQIMSEYPADPVSTDIDMKEDIALMVYTSGTTGLPKGAMLTYHNALFKTAAAVEVSRNAEDEVTLAVMPLFHIAGMLMGVNSFLYAGGTQVLLSRFDPLAVVQAVEKYRVTYWYSAAPMNVGIMQLPGITDRDFSSLRLNLCTSFGINLTEEIARAWQKIAPNCLIYEAAYGLSETHTLDTFMPWDNVKFGSVGIPIYDTEIKIVDPADPGKAMPQGAEGEMLLKTPGLFKGYWNRPEATAQALWNGWLRTGDIGKLDEDGYVYFLGRKKEMIKVSGYSVFPEEVETFLTRHEAVAQAAVIGVPDRSRGESVKAFLVLKQGYEGKVTEEDIVNWARDRMTPYKYPRQVEFRKALPMTGAGKILRRILAEEEKDRTTGG